MDSVTQMLLAGAAGQASGTCGQKRISRTLSASAFVSGLLPDMDVFIKIAGDPLSSIKYHRHFTHSLFFIPMGAAIVAAIFWILFKKKYSFKQIYSACFVGYASHAILDLCTSYGTQYLWPLTNRRFAWDFIAIVDPVYSGILFFGFFVAFFMRNKKVAVLSMVFSSIYILFGVWQNLRANQIQQNLAHLRGHTIERSRVLPSLANLHVWRSVYEYQGRFYVDAFFMPPFVQVKGWNGGSVPKFNLELFKSSLVNQELLKQDINTYEWFADKYLWQPEVGVLLDIRYSPMPESLESLWGIQFDERIPASRVRRIGNMGRDRQWIQEYLLRLRGEGAIEVSELANKIGNK